MDGIKAFLNKMNEETYQIVEEEESKNLAKEDALTLIAEFVKDVKKKFSKQEDRIEILKTALKTLEFFIEDILEGGEEDEFEQPEMDMDFDTDEEEPEETEDF